MLVVRALDHELIARDSYVFIFRQFRTISLESNNANAPSSCNSRGNSRPNSHHEVSDDTSSNSSNSEDEDSISHNTFAVSLRDFTFGVSEMSFKNTLESYEFEIESNSIYFRRFRFSFLSVP